MSKRYEPQNIEKKWQKIWQDEKAFAATDDYWFQVLEKDEDRKSTRLNSSH